MPQEPIHAVQAAASKLNIPYVTTNLSAAASHLTLSSAAEGSPDSNIKSVYKLTEPDSTVIALPLFHVHGLIAGLLSSFSAGAAATLPAAVSLALRLLVVMKADEGFEVMEAGNSREESNRDDKRTRLPSGQN
ncbi:hypothetical protein EV1_003008 [Malus domestica]